MSVEAVEFHRTRRGHGFYPTAAELQRIPALYATDTQRTPDKVVWLHYFVASSDWWLIEYDPDDQIGFGYVCLGGDEQSAEWGNVSLAELESVFKEGQFQLTGSGAGRIIPRLLVERDLHWTPRPSSECNLPGWRA